MQGESQSRRDALWLRLPFAREGESIVTDSEAVRGAREKAFELIARQFVSDAAFFNAGWDAGRADARKRYKALVDAALWEAARLWAEDMSDKGDIAWDDEEEFVKQGYFDQVTDIVTNYLAALNAALEGGTDA